MNAHILCDVSTDLVRMQIFPCNLYLFLIMQKEKYIYTMFSLVCGSL